jgi:acyl-CoA synthetase (AMP-forming)/AMP-acid ligase II
VVPDGELTPLAVRQAASERLPETMLPDRFVLVADLPLTSSSKVDERRLLKEAGLSAPRAETSAGISANRPEVSNMAILATNGMQ